MRAGIIWQQWLLYMTGGGTIAHVSLHETETYRDDNPFNAGLHCAAADPECSVTGSDHKIVIGWTVGFGNEVSIGPHISFAIEYRHSDFGQNSFNLVPTYSGNGSLVIRPPTPNITPSNNPLFPSPRSIGITNDIATLRVNYRFK
jgi:opacity protein-like surface antigen